MKYCIELTTQIADLLREGNNRTDTCLIADICYDTFAEWMKKAEFSAVIKKAEAEFKRANIVVIKNASIKSWQAAAWLLERKYRDEFALKITTEKTNEEQSKQAIDAAMAVLRLLENAGKNSNIGTNPRSDSIGLEIGKTSIQTESTPTFSV